MTFHDGEPFDAEAVQYKLTRDLTIKGSMRVGEVNAIAVDRGRRPPAHPPGAEGAQRPAAQHARRPRRHHDLAQGRRGGRRRISAPHPVCAGPYAFESRVAQDSIVLKRFPGYWDARELPLRPRRLPPHAELRRPPRQPAGRQRRPGRADPADRRRRRPQDPKLKLAIGDGLAYTGINFNLANGPAANTAIGQSSLVRHAFEPALDRAAINQVVYDGLYTPTRPGQPAQLALLSSTTRPRPPATWPAPRPCCSRPASRSRSRSR